MGKHRSALRLAQRRGDWLAYRTAANLKGCPVAPPHALASQSADWDDIIIRFFVNALLSKEWTDAPHPAMDQRQTTEEWAAT